MKIFKFFRKRKRDKEYRNLLSHGYSKKSAKLRLEQEIKFKYL